MLCSRCYLRDCGASIIMFGDMTLGGVPTLLKSALSYFLLSGSISSEENIVWFKFPD